MLAAGHRQKLLFFVIHQPEGGVTVAHSAGLRQGCPGQGATPRSGSGRSRHSRTNGIVSRRAARKDS